MLDEMLMRLASDDKQTNRSFRDQIRQFGRKRPQVDTDGPSVSKPQLKLSAAKKRKEHKGNRSEESV